MMRERKQQQNPSGQADLPQPGFLIRAAYCVLTTPSPGGPGTFLCSSGSMKHNRTVEDLDFVWCVIGKKDH